MQNIMYETNRDENGKTGSNREPECETQAVHTRILLPEVRELPQCAESQRYRL